MAQDYDEYAFAPPICKYYARGYCARGSSCFYSHSLAPCQLLPEPVPIMPAREPEPISTAKETDTCPDYDEGFCVRGSTCPFRHLQRSPDKVYRTGHLHRP